jgi:hypothetical protein
MLGLAGLVVLADPVVPAGRVVLEELVVTAVAAAVAAADPDFMHQVFDLRLLVH